MSVEFEDWMEQQPPAVWGESQLYQGGETDIGTQGRNVGWVQAPKRFARSWQLTLGAPNFGLGTYPPGGIPTAAFLRKAFAIVTWGLGGVQHSVEIDWRMGGGSYRFYGHSIQVASFVPERAPIFASRDLAQLRLKASIAPAMHGGGQLQPTRSRYIGTVTPETAVQVSIPPFARFLAPCFRVVNLAVPYQIEWFENATPICIDQGPIGLPPSFGLNGLWVPPTATSAAFRNLDTVLPPGETFFDVTFMFALNL
jgi:hypothetical protein